MLCRVIAHQSYCLSKHSSVCQTQNPTRSTVTCYLILYYYRHKESLKAISVTTAYIILSEQSKTEPMRKIGSVPSHSLRMTNRRLQGWSWIKIECGRQSALTSSFRVSIEPGHDNGKDEEYLDGVQCHLDARHQNHGVVPSHSYQLTVEIVPPHAHHFAVIMIVLSPKIASRPAALWNLIRQK